MDCPVCKTERLVISERQGIEIDYCPKCRGVWLDRGELDKIIERSTEVAPSPVQQAQPQYHQPSQAVQPAPQYYDQRRDYGHKKPKSIWHELFD
ncbi:zf-TFIIB domain-containing protein [Chitinibacter sp. S2-10]|uniref:TFIIB-type zinc ribbon-containing protein n=1 Tax=Chitinibacter sp. S2-10 TaxID=3373597 RepID=UPI00397787C2